MKRIIFRRLVIGLTATAMMLGNAAINTVDDVALSGKAMSVAEYLQSIRFGVKEAEAGIITGRKYNKILGEAPSALKSQYDKAVYFAYGAFMVGTAEITNGLPGWEEAANSLDLISTRATAHNIEPRTPKVAHAYHLIAIRFGQNRRLKNLRAEIKNSNRQLFEFSEGVFEMYEGIERNNPQSRKYYGPVPGYYRVAVEHFTNGLFLAAELGPNEFSSLGINYQPAMDMAGNAFEMAKVFREASLQGKIRILDVVKDKFKNVKFKEDAQTRPDSIEYDMESVYWNLGFYIMTENLIGNSSKMVYLDRKGRNDTDSLYGMFFNKFSYDTIHGGLIRN